MSGWGGLLTVLLFAVVVVPLLGFLFVHFLAWQEIWGTRVDLRRRLIVSHGGQAMAYSAMATDQFSKGGANQYVCGVALVLAVANGGRAIRQWRSDPEPAPADGSAENGNGGSPDPQASM